MKNLLNITSVKDLHKLRPAEKDKTVFEIVRCIDILHHFERDEYGEMLGKLCFLCGETLILQVKADNSEKYGTLRCQDGLTIPTAGRIKQQLNHFGFLVEERLSVGVWSMKFVADRMTGTEWDGKSVLSSYTENVIVTVPLSHPQFEKCWDWERTKERMERERQMIENFKLWYFAPLSYCRLCKRIHNGTHRLIVAKALGMQKIDVRILQDYTCRHTKTLREGRNPQL